jgi:hypothetical protein
MATGVKVNASLLRGLMMTSHIAMRVGIARGATSCMSSVMFSLTLGPNIRTLQVAGATAGGVSD